MSEPLTLRSDALSAQIAPLGAELLSLTDTQGRELMTDADPAFWTGHAPLLFPIVGRLRGDTYRLDGQSCALPQHGFARKKPFALMERHEAHALFRLEADAEIRANYPFDFRLDVAFALDGSTLTQTVTVHNMGSRDMPFSLGFHPAFAWPLPYGAPADAHRILFDEEEPAPIRRIGGEPGLIFPEALPSPVDDRTLRPTHAMFEADALIWDDLESRGLLWGAPGTPHLRIEFPDTPWLGIWQKPGARFLCIEPWAGMADPAGFEGDIWEKPGIIRLGPGAHRQFRLIITLQAA